MSELEKMLLQLEIKSIKELIDFHVKDAEIHGMTSEKQAHIDDILEILYEYLNRLNQDGNRA